MVVTTPHLVVCFFVGFKSLGDFVRLFFYFFCRCGGAHNHEQQPYFFIFFGFSTRPLTKHSFFFLFSSPLFNTTKRFSCLLKGDINEHPKGALIKSKEKKETNRILPLGSRYVSTRSVLRFFLSLSLSRSLAFAGLVSIFVPMARASLCLEVGIFAQRSLLSNEL